MCLKLSNFGDALKLLILSVGQKVIRGWVNISCIVISQKIIIVDTHPLIFDLIPESKTKQVNKSVMYRVIYNNCIDVAIYKNFTWRENKTLIGYRGSKSITTLQNFIYMTVKSVIVKEQRVDDNWLLRRSLRCTLTGSVSRYPILSFSKQVYSDEFLTFFVQQCKKQNSWPIIGFVHYYFSYLQNLVFPAKTEQRRYYTTPQEPLNPWWVAGLVDGGGSFIISIVENKQNKTGWRVELCIAIFLHKRDQIILTKIQ